jgi:hypothetical protein
MKWLERAIKWIMIVCGLLTCSMFYVAFAPQAALMSNFGDALTGPVADVVVRNWGALIGLIGVALIYGAFNVGARRLALWLAVLSKLTFIGLVLSFSRQFLSHPVAVSVVADAVMVLVFAAYLMRDRARA